MAKYVSTDYTGCEYITAGKMYEVIDEWGKGFNIIVDCGTEIFTLQHGSTHIDGNSWTVHEEPAIKLEVGKTYELNNGEIRKCIDMRGADPLNVGGYGFGPFVINGCYYHQDGAFGARNHPSLDVKREVIQYDRDQEMTSPYGDNNHPLPPFEPIEQRADIEAENARMSPEALDGVGDKPKTWGEMTNAEKGALLLARQEGKEIERWVCDEWISVTPAWLDRVSYRIKPEPKRETVTLECGCNDNHGWTGNPKNRNATHRITFTTTDGTPDLDSVKMEALG